MEQFWAEYEYTKPIEKALSDRYGTRFELYNTGGWCICLRGEFEGGIYMLVGCAEDGPLLHGSERSNFPFQGGYGVGVYHTATGDSLAHALDYRAQTGADVVQLADQALSLVSERRGDFYLCWRRDTDGNAGTEWWKM